MFIERQETTGAALVRMAELLGHEARWVGDEEHAVAMARSYHPHVVLVSVALHHHEDGYQIAGRLRALEVGRPLFLIALADRLHQDGRARSYAAGLDLHLPKPIGFATLRALLGQASPARTITTVARSS